MTTEVHASQGDINWDDDSSDESYTPSDDDEDLSQKRNRVHPAEPWSEVARAVGVWLDVEQGL